MCAAVVDNGWRGINNVNDERIVALSQMLRAASPGHAAANPKFRNPNGVKHKSNDLQTFRPGYDGPPTKGGKTSVAVSRAFEDDPGAMHDLARAIRAAITDPTPLPVASDLDREDATFDEGRIFERRHFARERDPKARRRKIDTARGELGHIACEVCKFDFEATYGERGRDFIECHHRNPLSVSGPQKTTLRDLALLCSNCHRMIHRGRPWLTVEELQRLL